MKSFFITLLLFISLIASAQKKSVSDTLSPLRVVEKYVSPDGFPDRLKYFCCELYGEWTADSTLGQHLRKSIQRSSELVFQDSAHATVAVWLHDSVISLDVYFYLVKNQNWTVYATRSLAMRQSVHDALKRLDSIPENERGKAYTKTHGHSYQFESANLKLWDSPDKIIAGHFNSHKKQFVQMQKRMVKNGFTKSDSLVVNAIKDKKIKKLAEQSLIRGFEYDKRYPHCIFYLIGGIADNTVGYMYQPDPKRIPLITEKHYIIIKSLGDGWYLFKTT